MAVVRGVKEKLHLPLYDSLFVRPKEQLREIESSSVLKFFVDVQGKTKLETNMQSASLLPHWNTFEARALRVVVSDLPVVFPEEIEACVRKPDSAHDNDLPNLEECLEQLCDLIKDEKQKKGAEKDSLDTIWAYVGEFENLVGKTKNIGIDLEGCLGFFRTLSDENTLGRMLELQTELEELAPDLSTVLRRTRIQMSKLEEAERFADKLDALPGTRATKILQKKFKDARACFDSFCHIADWVKGIQRTDFKKAKSSVDVLHGFFCTEHTRIEMLENIKQCLFDAQREIDSMLFQSNAPRTQGIQECLVDQLNKQAIPLDEQLFGNGTSVLSKLVYNSITTFSVGEKVMMQMPTWFFPSGAGPYSEDGNVVTHGFPSPEATFRFAEPVFIDTQQNFRVEIEIPEASELTDLQRLYGPLFIWVVLDGYMVRDVQ